MKRFRQERMAHGAERKEHKTGAEGGKNLLVLSLSSSLLTFTLALALVSTLLLPSPSHAVEKAPQISDNEIAERLARLEDGQKNLEKRLDALDRSLNKRIDDLRSEMNGKFADLRSEMNGKFADLRSEMNSRFDTLQWMLGLFITISLVILGFVLRMQWQMHRRQTRIETALETQKDEMAFLKSLIEKLLPPKGAL